MKTMGNYQWPTTLGALLDIQVRSGPYMYSAEKEGGPNLWQVKVDRSPRLPPAANVEGAPACCMKFYKTHQPITTTQALVSTSV